MARCQHADHGRPDGRRDGEGRRSRACPSRSTSWSPRPRAARRPGPAMVHVHIRDDEGRPTLDRARLTRHRRGPARADRPGRPALHRRQRPRPVRRPPGGARRRARLLLADLRHGELRRGRLPQPVAVHGRALPAHPGSARSSPSSSSSTSARCTALSRLLDQEGAPFGGHVHCDLVMGVPGGMPGTAEALVAAVAALPDGCSWSATGHRSYVAPGRPGRPVRRRSPAGRHGGHVDLRRGEAVRDNAQLVERAATLASWPQRPPMTVSEARALLRVKDRTGVAA